MDAPEGGKRYPSRPLPSCDGSRRGGWDQGVLRTSVEEDGDGGRCPRMRAGR